MKSMLSIFCIMTLLLQVLPSGLGLLPSSYAEESEEPAYVAPEGPSAVYNMNIDWKYKKPSTVFPLASAMSSVVKNNKNFYDVDYDDSDWETVSIPHQVNADNSFTTVGRDAGDGGQFRGIVFYRKIFTVPEDAAGKKIFLEFEGIYNAAYVWVNGQKAGYYEAISAPFGFDITDFVTAGQTAVIAVANDSTSGRGSTSYYRETVPGEEWGSSYVLNNSNVGAGVGYQWNSHDFTTSQAGLVYNVNLYIKGKVYQTLPLYSNLKTTGNYIYATDFNIREKKAKIHVKAEIRNETNEDKDVTLEVHVVENVFMEEEKDPDKALKPVLRYSFSNSGKVTRATDPGVRFETVVPAEAYQDGTNHDGLTKVDTVDVSYIEASYEAEGLNFWSPDTPYLYDVYTILKDSNGNVIDVQKITTGFRRVEYSLSDGLKINDKPIWLTGYAQRSANEWAAIGSPTDWLLDYDMQLVKESNANFIRWMHTAPRVNTVRATDQYGIVVVAPAGDKEGDVTGRQWSQRVEVMRDTMIRFRNSPSVIFWETGNASVTAAHQQEMTDLKAIIDPYGGRFSGCRSISGTDQIQATEYVGTMLNRYAANATKSMKELGKFVPIVETEYHREESPRRVWDDYSPPDYDYRHVKLRSDGVKTEGYDVYDLNSEEFAINDAQAYQEFYRDRVNGISGNNYYAAAAALCWTDSNQHSRSQGSENARMSGRVDPIRLKKQSFYAYQVMQSTEPKVHIIGHWSYEPMNDLSYEEGGNYWYRETTVSGSEVVETGRVLRRDPTKKTVYVVGTSAYITRVDLLVDGEVVGSDSTPDYTFIYSFPNIDVTKGNKVEAVAYNARNEEVARHEIKRTGDAVALRMTPHTGRYGLLADGSDLMYVDVEVVDAEGNVCPLNYDRIDFELTGDAKFMGGYNSGKFGADSVIGKNYVYAECGINRVFIKAGRTPGKITLKATLAGGKVPPVTITVDVKEYPREIVGGLTTFTQQRLIYGDMKIVAPPEIPFMKPLGKFLSVLKADWSESAYVYKYTDANVPTKDVYKVTVNGTELSFKSEPYKPDSVTGVLCEARTVLEALKALGANFEYTYDTSGEYPVLTMLASGHEIVAKKGQTALGLDGDPEGDLTNAEIYVENGELIVEINALLKYIPGVTVSVDNEAKVNAITYAESE